MLRFHDTKANQGFTIIETLIAVFVFSVIMIAVGGIFTQVLSLQRRGAGAQKVQEDTMYALELMAREIRVSMIPSAESLDCSAVGLFVIHPVEGAITYTLVGQQIQRNANGVVGFITSSETAISRLNFCVQGTNSVAGGGDGKQTRVTILMGAVDRDSMNSSNPITFDLQTTVTSRSGDADYTD